jgi:hypothetical protein
MFLTSLAGVRMATQCPSHGHILPWLCAIRDSSSTLSKHTNRSPHPSFHANLDRVDTWLQSPNRVSWLRRRAHLDVEIKSMLAQDSTMRPNAKQLLIEIVGYDVSQIITSQHSIFGACCRKQLTLMKKLQDMISNHKKERAELQKALFDSKCEQLRLNTGREQRAIRHENRMIELVVDLAKIKGQMEESVSKNSKLLHEIGYRESDINELAFELARVKDKLMKREAENCRLVDLVNTPSLQDDRL